MLQGNLYRCKDLFNTKINARRVRRWLRRRPLGFLEDFPSFCQYGEISKVSLAVIRHFFKTTERWETYCGHGHGTDSCTIPATFSQRVNRHYLGLYLQLTSPRGENTAESLRTWEHTDSLRLKNWCDPENFRKQNGIPVINTSTAPLFLLMNLFKIK